MNNICPIYKNDSCVLKENFSNKLIFVLLDLQDNKNITLNCEGQISKCSFTNDEKETTPNVEEKLVDDFQTKVSIHKYDNPYLIKSDILVYPTNIVLTIDDNVLNIMSRGIIQEELDKIQKPIKMGTVYVTSNGGANSKVQSKKVYHAVVAGESRLVNEADIKFSIRKALHLANEGNHRNIVMIPPDCGTHDINDVARVHLSAVKTFLQTQKCNLKNIFIVMSDQESYEVYEQYYRRIFK